ncbi:TIGR03986 family type III CRISPR-associated RAMP protein [Pseudonocardia alni]|uniref:TIGR03986 family type III CRISPR-associated RAMP protein n=1 Tax=Pseudonocardia alni TaxID=33907 RepID=UPI0033D2C1E5
MPEFHNPYAFVPAPARFDDGEPAPVLGSLTPGRWTGRLRLKIRAKTPLLITEQDEADTFRTRRTRQIDGAVTLPATSVKGMIRSEFETVTNSRFGVFDPYDRRLGHRIGATDTTALVPVRVARVGGRLTAWRFDGEPIPGEADSVRAAWVPRYGRRPASDPDEVGHGALVSAWALPMTRWAPNRRGDWTPLHFWRVLSMRPQRHAAPQFQLDDHVSDTGRRRYEVRGTELREIRGIYVETGRNIKSKHDERIFFAPEMMRGQYPPTVGFVDDADAAAEWADLIASYRDAQAEKPPEALEFSRHLTDPTSADLTTPTFAYAEMAGDLIRRLYPVAISRKLFDRSPRTLAEQASITPARTRDELSPADRLFGWVPPDGRATGRTGTRALRGRVRLGRVETITAEVKPVDKGLAILGRPRPTQDLFYAAADAEGGRLTGSPGYRDGGGLRGRKVYPHQPRTTFDLNNPRQSWLLHGDGAEVGRQNARLLDMVAAKAVFEVDVHLEDVTAHELGVLLHVLAGPDATAAPGRIHKLGGGKPLGFGSVTLEVDWGRSDVRDTAAWRSMFLLDDGNPAKHRLRAGPAAALVAAAVAALDAEVVRHHEAYLAGFPGGLPVRYPADPQNPGSDEDRYEWFVANRRHGPTVLGALIDPGGPTLPVDPRPNGAQR